MTTQSNPCDRHQLELLMTDRLDETQQFDIQQHLETCNACRETLELMAGEPGMWHDTSRFLRLDPLDLEVNACRGDSLIGSESPLDADVPLSDFVVDFLAPSDNPAMLGRLGEYEVLEVIGRGGMGVVLKGYDRELNRCVAIKVMSPHLASSAAARRRFAREAQAAAAVVHQHVIAIHTVETTAALPYIVMQYVAGESLQHRLNLRGPLELRDVLCIGMQTAYGLAAAHAQGLVHRDVKPANILMERGVDRVLLGDFGLARTIDDASMTHSSVIAGTPQYMSPEQARGDCVDYRSDLFSLGSVMYAMCTGRPPFRAETTLGVLRRITDSLARPIRDITPEIPDWLCEIIDKLLAKKASDRFASAEEVHILLGRWLAHVQQPHVVTAPRRIGNARSPRSTGWWWKHRVAVMATCVGAVVLAASLIVLGPAIRSSDSDTRTENANANELNRTGELTSREGGAEMPQGMDDSLWRDELARLANDVVSIENHWAASEIAVDDWEMSISRMEAELAKIAAEIDE